MDIIENISNNEEEEKICSICLENKETNIKNCKRCNNINCIECYNKMEKKIKIENEELIIIFKCPLCSLDNEINILEKENIEKYESKKIVINYLTELTKVNTANIIHIKNLVEKIGFLEYYIKNVKNIMKYFFIFDKIITVGAVLLIALYS